MKKIMNRPEDYVSECLAGFVQSRNNLLLDKKENIVYYRSKREKGRIGVCCRAVHAGHE